jgi:cell division protein FtsI/penicillin-binding protein 2
VVKNLEKGSERERRVRTRALPLALVALVAFIFGAMSGAQGNPEKDAAQRFSEAWAKQDFEAMHAELSDLSATETSVEELEAAYAEAQTTATLEAIDVALPEDAEDESGQAVVPVPVIVDTIAFGQIGGELRIPYTDGEGGGIKWDPSLVFPGLQEGEELRNNVRVAPRAPILARDGTPLAEGDSLSRTSPLGSSAIDVVGVVGEAPEEIEDELAAQGYPPGTPVGISGLELAFNSHLAGKPGGTLVAYDPETRGEPRVLGRSKPKPGKPVKTWIDPELQEAAVIALAGRIGGIAALDAKTGNVLALAGTAFSAPRPPGSTFKIITTTAALQENLVTLEDQFPYLSSINAGGRVLENANGEICGGSFPETFAHSCNTVFAPLGVEVGEDRLVAAAEAFGFNEPPSLYNDEALELIDPPNSDIPEDPGDDVDLAASAIGQGEVIATPLAMASVAQTVANDGVRMPTSVVRNPELQPDAEPVRVMSPKLANTITDLMVDVVTYGTGTAGAIAEGQVAGKTGTAELGPQPGNPDVQILDAWFTAFAPSENPQIAAAMMLNDAGASGGEVAAPAIAAVLSAGL